MGKSAKHKKKNILSSFFFYYMIAIGISAPVTTIPQLIQVWTERRVEGLSVVTWVSYAIFAGSWLVYGIINKQKPIIITQIFLLPMDLLIVLGILLFK